MTGQDDADATASFAPTVIATSGPSATFPTRAFRNPLDVLVNFLDEKHGSDWCIWEFRAEGTGYPDSAVYGRIHHFPWPDHNPPPFALLPVIVGSMHNWIERLDEREEERKGKKKRVAVVHCKAGKGRSGTVACSYLISQEGWEKTAALQRFTERRMREGFGAGVGLSSQVRWVDYMDRWANRMGKVYVERPVEVLELHIWGLRSGVKAAIEGFVDEGKKIKCFHFFRRSECTVVDDGKTLRGQTVPPRQDGDSDGAPATGRGGPDSSTLSSNTKHTLPAVILRPCGQVIVPTSDVNICFEQRKKAAYTGWTIVTSGAHAWFNAYFEGGDQHDSGVFEVEWGAMDAVNGNVKKGARALDRLKVVWRYASASQCVVSQAKAHTQDNASHLGKRISEPLPGEPVPESHPADWRGAQPQDTLDIDDDGNDNDDSMLGGVRNMSGPAAEISGQDEMEDLSSSAAAGKHPVSTTAAFAAASMQHSISSLSSRIGLHGQAPAREDAGNPSHVERSQEKKQQHSK